MDYADHLQLARRQLYCKDQATVTTAPHTQPQRGLHIQLQGAAAHQSPTAAATASTDHLLMSLASLRRHAEGAESLQACTWPCTAAHVQK